MQTNEMIEELIDLINEYSVEGEDFEAIFAFDGRVSPVPIDKTYIAFSTNETAVGFFEDENEETCKKTDVTIAVDFYFSPRRKAKEIYSLCESVMDYLMVEYAGKMTDYSAGELKIDDNLRLVRLPCRMSFTFEQCPAYASGGATILPFADFLCKTHVNDGTAHLSAADKAYLSEPVAVGTYVGNGESSKTVSLGFRPKALFIFQSGSSMVALENGSVVSLFGAAAGSRAGKGVSLSENGFSVSSENSSAYGVQTKLNSLAQTYVYVAMR